MIDISVCIVYRSEDERFLEQCQESLPAGVQLCAVLCEEHAGPIEHFGIIREYTAETGTHVRQAVWQYPRGEFRFDHARNVCLKLATRGWCLALDADERLVEHQWQDWVQATVEAPHNMGGLTVNVWGSTAMPGGLSRNASSQVRLFRNRPELYFRKRVHEFFGLQEAIVEAGMDIVDSTLAIHHVGYEATREDLLKKCARNIRLCIRELADRPDQADIETKLFDTLRLQHELR